MSYPENHHAQAVQIPVLSNRLKLDNSEIFIKTTQELIDEYMSKHGVTYDKIFPPQYTQDFDSCEKVREVLDLPEWTKPYNEY